jgi:hypothetical protein
LDVLTNKSKQISCLLELLNTLVEREQQQMNEEIFFESMIINLIRYKNILRRRSAAAFSVIVDR